MNKEYKPLGTRKIYTDENDNMFILFMGIKIELSDMLRCHNNPWVFDEDYPEYIHAMYYFGQYYLYFEVLSDEELRIYREK